MADVLAVDVSPRPAAVLPVSSPWLTTAEAANYLRTSQKTVWRLVRDGHLRHAKIGGRRDLRFRADWLDEHLLATSEPVEVRRG